MKLEEIYPFIPDTVNVRIKNQEDSVLAIYDGKDSIPKKYNEREIVELRADNNCLEITVIEEGV